MTKEEEKVINYFKGVPNNKTEQIALDLGYSLHFVSNTISNYLTKKKENINFISEHFTTQEIADKIGTTKYLVQKTATKLKIEPIYRGKNKSKIFDHYQMALISDNLIGKLNVYESKMNFIL